MGKIWGMIKGLFTGVTGLVGIIFMLLLSLGELYWFWMAIQLGSFYMFAVGFIPPIMLITAPVGAWSFLFGPPMWVLNWFGK